MPDYVPHSPAFAEKEHRWRLTGEELDRRLGNASPGQLRQIWHDENEPIRVRYSALARLAWACPDDPEVTQVLLDMLGAPDLDPRVRALSMQITSDVRWSDPRLMQKACSLLDNPDGNVAGLAAILLAVRWDYPILPLLRTWLQGDEQARRRIATNTLRLMNTPDARRILRDEWERTSRGEEDRVYLASVLSQKFVRKPF